LHSSRERTEDARKRKKSECMHAARLKLERKALVALPPCCIGESLKNPKESDGDGWMGWGDPRNMTPPDLCSPQATAIVVFPLATLLSHSLFLMQMQSQHREIEYSPDMHAYAPH
jgi:hypothetical protein